MKKCYDHEECEYNAQPDCVLPEGAQCPHGVPTVPPVTNADKIRAMSDEDMAIWLAEWSFCADACPASTNEVEEAIGYCCPSNCKEQALTWLQQPAEEEA